MTPTAGLAAWRRRGFPGHRRFGVRPRKFDPPWRYRGRQHFVV